MKKILAVTAIVIIVIAIAYGATVLLSALGLWALVKLGVLTAWTWKQAALVAIIISIIEICTTKTVKVKKEN